MLSVTTIVEGVKNKKKKNKNKNKKKKKGNATRTSEECNQQYNASTSIPEDERKRDYHACLNST
jgi:hypothetical protein